MHIYERISGIEKNKMKIVYFVQLALSSRMQLSNHLTDTYEMDLVRVRGALLDIEMECNPC